jgi:hypothetical protein
VRGHNEYSGTYDTLTMAQRTLQDGQRLRLGGGEHISHKTGMEVTRCIFVLLLGLSLEFSAAAFFGVSIRRLLIDIYVPCCSKNRAREVSLGQKLAMMSFIHTFYLAHHY